MSQKVQKKKFELRLNYFQNSFLILPFFQIHTVKSRKYYDTNVFVNFSFLFTTISRFSEYNPWTYFSGGGGREGGRGLIFGVKIKLRNAWAYFRGNLYTGGAYFPSFTVFFFYLGFLSQTFTIHKTAEEGGGYFFNSSLPLLPASQKLEHQPSKYCRELIFAHSQQPDSNRLFKHFFKDCL